MDLYKRSASAAAIMSNLICYCSMATVSGTLCFLPPSCLGSLASLIWLFIHIMWKCPAMGVPQNGWLATENSVKILYVEVFLLQWWYPKTIGFYYQNSRILVKLWVLGGF